MFGFEDEFGLGIFGYGFVYVCRDYGRFAGYM